MTTDKESGATVRTKAVELADVARTVIRELAAKDGSPEGEEAGRILDKALQEAIPPRPRKRARPSKGSKRGAAGPRPKRS